MRYPDLHDPTDQEFAERCALRHLQYRGFTETTDICRRCGRTPVGSSCLHSMFDPISRERLEYGVHCFPTYLIPALQIALRSEDDRTRLEHIRWNLNAILVHRDYPKDWNRCRVAQLPRPASELDTPLPDDQYILGGYRFVVQRISFRTFTVRIYDDELIVFGKAWLLHEEKWDLADIGNLMQPELVRIGEFGRDCLSRGEKQPSPDYKVCRFDSNRLAI